MICWRRKAMGDAMCERDLCNVVDALDSHQVIGLALVHKNLIGASYDDFGSQ
jgi:hypothetical protein